MSEDRFIDIFRIDEDLDVRWVRPGIDREPVRVSSRRIGRGHRIERQDDFGCTPGYLVEKLWNRGETFVGKMTG